MPIFSSRDSRRFSRLANVPEDLAIETQKGSKWRQIHPGQTNTAKKKGTRIEDNFPIKNEDILVADS